MGSNNQITTTGFGYDASGNLSSDGLNNYVWNAESEVKSVAGFTYTYDGDGNRVEKSSGKIYWYGAGTEILDESDASGNFTNEYVFFGGKRVAMRTVSSGTIDYYEDDMLGSARVMVQAGATSPCFDADFLPFGQEVDFTSTCGSNYKFEGKERDLETGNDDFGARYYRSALGRWLSADWSDETEPIPYANLEDPQTLNLYSFARNNPERAPDTDGHRLECGPDTYSKDENGNLVVTAHCHEVPDLILSLRCLWSCSAADQAKLNLQSQSYLEAVYRGEVPVYASTPPGPGDLEALEDLGNLLQDIKNGLTPTAESSTLQKIIDELFQSTDKLPGGTAGAVRKELETGEAVGGKFHSIKAGERATQLQKLINRGILSSKDTNLARALVEDLRRALAGN